MTDVVVASTVEQVRAWVEGCPPGSLFRGQVRDYRDATGRVSMRTSQARNGCEPPLQHKWTYYASILLELLGHDVHTNERHRAQALLQHYGWRSFFLDATDSPPVAAWFASHKFSLEHVLNLAKDCNGLELMAERQFASYAKSESEGFLYCISRETLAGTNVMTFNLTDLAIPGQRPRPAAQRGWLVGPVPHEGLPPDAVVRCLSAPAHVLADYAAENHLVATHDLFPSPEEDPILESFLSIPWQNLPHELAEALAPDVFVRGLRLPEYHHDVRAVYPATCAFFRRAWIADRRTEPEHPLRDATFLRVHDTLFYMRRVEPAPLILPLLLAKVKLAKVVVVESEYLMRYPTEGGSSYTKAVLLEYHGDDVVEICELGVEHPGRRMIGVWQNRGWFYTVNSTGEWMRTSREGECGCKTPVRHRQHEQMLVVIEDMMSDDRFVAKGPQDYTFVPPA